MSSLRTDSTPDKSQSTFKQAGVPPLPLCSRLKPEAGEANEKIKETQEVDDGTNKCVFSQRGP